MIFYLRGRYSVYSVRIRRSFSLSEQSVHRPIPFIPLSLIFYHYPMPSIGSLIHNGFLFFSVTWLIDFFHNF